MKRLLCASLIAVTLITGNTSYINANASTITQVVNTVAGKTATVYTSSDAHENKSGTKSSVSVSFIDDPQNSDLTALISITGFIPSNLTRSGDYYWGKLKWPSKYNVTVETLDNDEVKILQSIPSNKVETVQVSESMGYTVGGNVSASKDSASAGVNGSFSVNRSISYQQPDFKTTQKKDKLRAASWDIEFNGTKDGYDKNSYHAFYGNQLFMRSRLYNTGINNLTEDKNLSPLISGGFSPEMVIAVKMPRDAKERKSRIMLNYTSYMDVYTLNWGVNWYGENKSDKPISTYHFYELDWDNHTVKKEKDGYFKLGDRYIKDLD